MGERRSAVENVVQMKLPDPFFWQGRRVLVTGHTGFKGSWLCLWLQQMGAEVSGIALDPPTSPNLYEVAHVADGMAEDERIDINDVVVLSQTIRNFQPEIVLHLAAQSLVRPSYSTPLETFTTNVIGTAHVLEAVRLTPSVRAVVVVTTDKCYENREWVYSYRENDALGGHDPYSASKAGAELVTASWRASFFSTGDSPRVASARAGNVIGAGDWASERLLPDCFRAFSSGEALQLRHPYAIRPWQHVLEPLAGYLVLAEQLFADNGQEFARGWNFGPDPESDASVGEVAQLASRFWGEAARVELPHVDSLLHEAGLLRLDSTLARTKLRWRPRWNLERAVAETMRGYQAYAAGTNLRTLVIEQIAAYQASSDTNVPV